MSTPTGKPRGRPRKNPEPPTEPTDQETWTVPAQRPGSTYVNPRKRTDVEQCIQEALDQLRAGRRLLKQLDDTEAAGWLAAVHLELMDLLDKIEDRHDARRRKAKELADQEYRDRVAAQARRPTKAAG